MRVTTEVVMMMRPWKTTMLPCLTMTRTRSVPAAPRRRPTGKTSLRIWKSKCWVNLFAINF